MMSAMIISQVKSDYEAENFEMDFTHHKRTREKEKRESDGMAWKSCVFKCVMGT